LIDVPLVLIVIWIHHRTFQQQTSDTNQQATPTPDQHTSAEALVYEKPGNRMMTQILLNSSDARMYSNNQLEERLSIQNEAKVPVDCDSLSSASTVKTKSDTGTVVSQNLLEFQ